MRGRLARAIRQWSRIKWQELSEDMKTIVTPRALYKQMKKEYKDEKRR